MAVDFLDRIVQTVYRQMTVRLHCLAIFGTFLHVSATSARDSERTVSRSRVCFIEAYLPFHDLDPVEGIDTVYGRRPLVQGISLGELSQP